MSFIFLFLLLQIKCLNYREFWCVIYKKNCMHKPSHTYIHVSLHTIFRSLSCLDVRIISYPYPVSVSFFHSEQFSYWEGTTKYQATLVNPWRWIRLPSIFKGERVGQRRQLRGVIRRQTQIYCRIFRISESIY